MTTVLTFLAAFFIFATGTLALAADLNGYTAQYECRAGGPNCNVDVATLSKRACKQTITPSAPWTSINWSNDTICIQAGDHTPKGTLSIPSSADGSPTNFKVLRFVPLSPNDSDIEPWRQAPSNQARLTKLEIDGADYLLINRLTFPAVDASINERIAAMGFTSNVIINEILIDGAPQTASTVYSGFDTVNCGTTDPSKYTIQNSVIRDYIGNKPNTSTLAISIACGTDMRIVNNEIYDFSEHAIQVGHNGGPTMPGLIVENNDLYYTPAIYVNNGTRARAENIFDVKARGISSNPIRIIQNRFWGARSTDASLCCTTGSVGVALAIVPPGVSGFSHILIQNNIIGESQYGMTWTNGESTNQSIIGNIFYGMRVYNSSFPYSHAVELGNITTTEMYLNTFVDNELYGLSFGGGLGNSDILCNVFLMSGQRQGGTPDNGTRADFNAFYDTPAWTFNGTGNKLTMSVVSRGNSVAYSSGNLVRTATAKDCQSPNDSACFIYTVTRAGTTAGSAPSYCTSLGCTTIDGSATLRAIRGPYSFYRKLRTTQELRTIPYVRAYIDPNDFNVRTPEAYSCPSDFSARPGLGISD